MIKVDVRVHLQHLRVIRRNEDSPDEPFLWVMGLKFDGVTSKHLLADGLRHEDILQRAMRAELEFFTPRGEHGNLGPASDDVDHDRPIAIPRALGKWDTSLQIDIADAGEQFKDPTELAQVACLAMMVVALEEDGTKDSHAIEAHRRVIERVKARATIVLRQVLADAIGGLTDPDQPPPTPDEVRERLEDRLSPRAIREIIGGLEDDVVPVAVIRTIVNMLTLPAAIAQADPDDHVGWGVVHYSMPGLIGQALDGFPIELELNGDRTMADIARSLGADLSDEVRERLEREIVRGDDGRYRVTGRAYRTDLREPPTIASVRHSDRALVIGRGNDGHAFGAAMLDDGRRASWRRLAQGVFSSGIAAASPVGSDDIVVVGRGMDKRIWLGRTDRGLEGLESIGWQPMPPLQSEYGAAVAVAGQGDRVHVFAVDEQHRVRWSWSRDNGSSWTLPWGLCGQAILDATPAAAITDRGEHLNVFGLGQDRNIWRAYSPDGGIHWTHLWSQSGMPLHGFDSAPAVAMSNDGKRLFLCAKSGGRLFVLRSDDYGNSWSPSGWRRLGVPELGEGREPAFISAPAVSASPDFSQIFLFAVCSDLKMYWRRVIGDDWSAWRPVGDRLFA